MPKLHQILETRNRKEQERRVAGMKEMLETPVIAVTLLSYLGQVKLDVLGSQSIDTRQVKEVLQAGIDDLTRMEVLQEQEKMRQMAPPPTPEDDKRLEEELLEAGPEPMLPVPPDSEN